MAQPYVEGTTLDSETLATPMNFLTEAKEHQEFVDWDKTQTNVPQDKCIHQLFEEQVALTPDALAVVFENQKLTYRELNQLANQLAHYLQALGVQPETLVGICVERSLHMAIGILGILKAGGAYVPLDPAYPQDRLSYMLDNAQVSILLTQQQLMAETSCRKGLQAICLDADWPTIAQYPCENLIHQTSPDNLVYVIYTSGSTGLPKGVLLEHKALVGYAVEIAQQFNLKPNDRFLQFAALGFDVVVEEIFPTWISGAAVIIPNYTRALPCLELVQLMQIQQVSVVELPTAYWHQLVDELHRSSLAAPTALRLVIIGGEQVSLAHLRTWQQFRVPLIHVYGLTEASVTSTTYHLPEYEELEAKNTTIGSAIANTQIYILDSHLQPVPVGVTGELYIGGEGLARGYLNRPELTAEKFIPNPFSTESSSRLYKTGDLARYFPDGNLELIGRIDRQVKVRGFRIELGEVEAAFSLHPDIQQLVVVVREDAPGDKRLVAYYVTQSETVLARELRQFVQDKLPLHMIPSAFVPLDALPFTPNGKIDRSALPAPTVYPELEPSFIAPATPAEAKLANIWSAILRIEQIGIHDNFFELGGHSLLATQIISRINQVWAVEIPLRQLFEFPTISQLATCIEHLTHQERPTQALPLRPGPRPAEMPLSFAQQRLWFLDQLHSNHACYNIPIGLHLHGHLDLRALEASLNEIIIRHEALRTNFKMVQGQPTQVIAPKLNLCLQRLNLQSLNLQSLDLNQQDPNQQETEVQRAIRQIAQQSFNLAEDALIRTALLQLDETENILLVSIHHIVFDGWSVGVFFQELSLLYAAYSIGESPILPDLPVQYADFTLWQRQGLDGLLRETQLAYWQNQLANAPVLLELPTDRPRPATQSFRGASQPFTLSQELSTALISLSHRLNTTLFMVLLAAFQVLLHRYSGQEDICIGTPVANRSQSQLEALIGFFVNTLVLRTDLSDNPRFEDLLNRVREVSLEAYAHQDLPFEELVEALRPTRSLSHTPLFQVMFDFRNTPSPLWKLPNLAIDELSIGLETAQFDLTLSLEQRAQDLIGEWEYNTDLFDSSTITRMSRHYQTLLESIVASPTQRISDLPLLPEPERHQLVVEWNDTQSEYSQNKCIHQLFEEQVERTPDATAVIFEDQQLTYRELNQRANQLAHYLQTLGVGPETLVGICVERSPEMVIGILGILKAGGAYVPLDPDYPKDRISFMIEDADVSIIVTKSHMTDQSFSHQTSNYQIHTIKLDREWSKIAQYSELNLAQRVKSNNLAYVIYTSGSTGKPKGVLIEHHSLVNYILAASVQYNIGERDRILQFTSLSFDVSAEEIYTSLVTGASLVLRTETILVSSQTFMQKCQEWGITVAMLPTAYWHDLTARLEGIPLPPSLKLVVVGGERLLLTRVKQWYKSVGNQVKLINAYGPTESTISALWYDLSKLNLTGFSSEVPIGRPIANTRVYILDKNLQSVPVGVTGELYIGGDGLARGYLNLPGLTTERFIPDFFNQEPNARLYKTGDLVRYLPDGNIEFLDRIDHQVKIRGFRIELGEVEAVLSQHPDVREAVVIARENSTGDQQLVAYVVLHQHAVLHPKGASTISTLRRFLKEQLPQFMEPSAFMVLEALPLMLNGKLDRRALPEPKAQFAIQSSVVPPQTPTEKMLVLNWAEVLGVQTVGVNDNFFELGGHSLQAASLIAQISTKTNLQISPKLLFNHPTVAELAKAIDQLSAQNKFSNQEHTLNQARAQSNLAEQVTTPLSNLIPGASPFQASPSFKLEQRPLLSLFAVGKIAPIDSAALGYIPLSLLQDSGLTRDQILQNWFDNLPMWDSVIQTKWGRIGSLTLPIFEDELYSSPEKLVEMTVEALEMAGRIGAKTLSLTGLIPAATDYGQSVAAAVKGRSQLPKVTIGYATTCATVVLTIKKILQVSNRSLEKQQVAFISLGSIGLNSLRLMLKCLPHPDSIILYDMYHQLESIQNIRRELVSDLDFRGSIKIVSASSEMPPEIYDATFIIGAANVPDILDIERVKPSTLIVDYSSPHCFSPEQAIKRFEQRQDILFTEGGVLQSPDPIETTLSLPQAIQNDSEHLAWKGEYLPINSTYINGCIMSSLLPECCDHLEPTIGLLNLDSSMKYYQALEHLGFQAADLHCEDYVLKIGAQ